MPRRARLLPRLLEADCRSIEEMRLVNALCRFVELATPVSVPDTGRAER